MIWRECRVSIVTDIPGFAKYRPAAMEFRYTVTSNIVVVERASDCQRDAARPDGRTRVRASRATQAPQQRTSGRRETTTANRVVRLGCNRCCSVSASTQQRRTLRSSRGRGSKDRGATSRHRERRGPTLEILEIAIVAAPGARPIAN